MTILISWLQLNSVNHTLYMEWKMIPISVKVTEKLYDELKDLSVENGFVGMSEFLRMMLQAAVFYIEAQGLGVFLSGSVDLKNKSLDKKNG